SGILTAGVPTFNPHEMENQSKADVLSQLDQGVTQLVKDAQELSEEEWESGAAGWAPEAKSGKKGHMAWDFLFDAIHHRGQLSTFLRGMGAKVPSIYGPSADEDGGF